MFIVEKSLLNTGWTSTYYSEWINVYYQTSNIRDTKSQTYVSRLILQLSAPTSDAPDCIWVMNNFIAYWGATLEVCKYFTEILYRMNKYDREWMNVNWSEILA